MPARTYAQIECSLKGSKKIRGLSSHKVRWVYLCAHLSDFATYTGVFRYPRPMWAYDAQLDPDGLDDAIAELIEAGLIDYDAEDDFIRIVGWFHKRSGPDNPNRVQSVIADLTGLSELPEAMLQKASAELVCASVKRSLRWTEDSGARSKLYKMLSAFLREVHLEIGDALIVALRSEMEASSAAVQSEIGAIFPPLTITGGTGEGNRSGRVTPTLPEHETKTRRDET